MDLLDGQGDPLAFPAINLVAIENCLRSDLLIYIMPMPRLKLH